MLTALIGHPMNRRTALYSLYDANDNLLYVGVGFKPELRWVLHAREKPWWAEVARKEVVWFESRIEALEAEADAIKSLKPRYNVAGKERPPLAEACLHGRVANSAELASYIRGLIESGALEPADRLPSEDDFRKAYGLAILTINRAIKELRRMGVVDWVRGYGVVVREPREIERVYAEPGSRVTARPSTTEEQEEWGEGVSALILWHVDGTGDVYPGDRTEFYTDPDG
jgi:hypothetical protein